MKTFSKYYKIQLYSIPFSQIKKIYKQYEVEENIVDTFNFKEQIDCIPFYWHYSSKWCILASVEHWLKETFDQGWPKNSICLLVKVNDKFKHKEALIEEIEEFCIT